jgi:hypothetical protein
VVQRGGFKQLLTVRGMERKGLYAASSGSLSGFSVNLASTSPQSAHWKY